MPLRLSSLIIGEGHEAPQPRVFPDEEDSLSLLLFFPVLITLMKRMFLPLEESPRIPRSRGLKIELGMSYKYRASEKAAIEATSILRSPNIYGQNDASIMHARLHLCSIHQRFV